MFYLIVSIFCILQSSLCLGSEGVVEAAPRKINLNAQLILDPQLQTSAGRQLIASFQDGSQKETVQFIINYADKFTDPSINKRPVGLKNVGNSCYLNSALQLLNTMDHQFNVEIDEAKDTIGATDLSSTFTTLLKNLHAKGQETVNGVEENPKKFEKLVHYQIFAAEDETRPQRDSNEFITAFLDNEAFSDLAKQFTIKSLARLRYKNRQLWDKPEENFYKELTIELGQNDLLYESLESLLALKFDKEEAIDEVNIGEKKKRAYKKEYLTEAGAYLIVSLKRNMYLKEEKATIRLKQPTPFPLISLHLGDYCEPKNPDMPHYELLGVIMHSGSGTGGHYVAYTRGIVAGRPQWFLCNDKVVTPISDLDMTRIALRGYGSHKGFLPTTFLYKRMEPANNPPPIDLLEANDAAFLVASVKDGVCQVIMENLEGKPAHVQELAQSLKTLLEERPAKEIEDTETGITKSKSRSCWNKPDFFIKVIGIAIIALIIHALCENNKKNQKKKGPHSPKNDSTETKNSKIADRLTTAYSGPVALGKSVLESLLKKGSE